MTIFVLQKNGDVDVFLSSDEAASYMESPDIESGEYVRAFDEKGNVLSITTKGTIRESGMTLIPRSGILTPTPENDANGLHTALQRRFAPHHTGTQLTLEELVLLAIRERAETARRRQKIRVTFVAILIGLIATLFVLGVFPDGTFGTAILRIIGHIIF